MLKVIVCCADPCDPANAKEGDRHPPLWTAAYPKGAGGASVPRGALEGTSFPWPHNVVSEKLTHHDLLHILRRLMFILEELLKVPLPHLITLSSLAFVC